MENRLLISVIIPVFNVKNRLKDCVDSVLNQSFQDFEIIVVDDGSFDGTETLCDNLLESDCRIRVVHKKNGGASSARNLGLDLAKGPYIAFIDSDDYIDKFYLELLYKEMLFNEVDFVRLSCFRGRNRLNYNLHYDINGRCILDHDNLNSFGPLIFVWGCMFKKECIGSIRFDESIHYNEDKLFVISVFLGLKRNRFVVVDQPLYHQVLRKSSLSNVGICEKRLSVFKAVDKIIDKCKGNQHLLYLAKCNKRASYYSLLKEIVWEGDCKKNAILISNVKRELKLLRSAGYRSQNKREDLDEWLYLYVSPTLLFYALGLKGIIRRLYHFLLPWHDR